MRIMITMSLSRASVFKESHDSFRNAQRFAAVLTVLRTVPAQELGDGRSSRFSHHGRSIKDKFDSRCSAGAEKRGRLVQPNQSDHWSKRSQSSSAIVLQFLSCISEICPHDVFRDVQVRGLDYAQVRQNLKHISHFKVASDFPDVRSAADTAWAVRPSSVQ